MTQRVTDRLGRVLLAFAWFDLGLVILLLPWSHFWESNSLLARYPDLIPYFLSGYLRGAISGIGHATINPFSATSPTGARSRRSRRPALWLR
jgi:hypothetical protein